MALPHDPNSEEALLSSAALHYNRGEFRQTAGLCERALRGNPLQPEALHLLGLALLGMRDLQGARTWLSRAASLLPGPEVLTDLAGALSECGDYDAAVQCCRHALELDPRHAEAHYEMGMALHWQKNSAAAIASLREAVRLQPGADEIRIDLARVLIGAGDFRGARQELDPMLGKKTVLRAALAVYGIACHHEGDFDRAIDCLGKAAQGAPDPLDATISLANAYRDSGDYARAAEHYEKALVLAPDSAEARNDYSHALLADGSFERGWELYESRWEANRWTDHLRYRQPRWKGEALAGKRLLVWGEQGIGNEEMFAGILPEIQARGAAVTLVCDPKLTGLFARSFAPAAVVARNSEAHKELLAAPFDYQVPIASLGQHFRRSFAEFPQHSGYLRADEAKVRAWRERLAAMGPGKKVAISWRGGFVGTRRHLRSIDVEAWLPILRTPGIEFISLQYTEGAAAELEALQGKHGVRVHHWPEVIEDYDETAALVCALDAVVSVCTALIHLTGALGRPVWILVPAVPEWRYMRQGDRMPWYPSARLLRQPRVGEWEDVIARMAETLRGWAV
jgi:tetratricopeptide (TPR) repeat protein